MTSQPPSFHPLFFKNAFFQIEVKTIVKISHSFRSSAWHWLALFSILIAGGSFASTAFASEVNDAKIKTLAVFKDEHPGLVFIEAVGQKTAAPTCHTNGLWTYVLRLTNDDDKRLFALLTIAKLNQSGVRLVGRYACESAGNIEALSQVWLN